jgi:hypothetical protein
MIGGGICPMVDWLQRVEVMCRGGSQAALLWLDSRKN